MLPSPLVLSLVDLNILRKSIQALLKLKDNKDNNKKVLLEDESEDELQLVLSLTSTINGKGDPVPKPLFLPHGTEAPKRICVIVKDNLDIPSSKGLIEILPITKLRQEYKPFEARRRLLAEFNLFLADKRIIPLLPSLLGKKFFKKKKLPIPIAIKENKVQDMAKQMAMKVTPLYIPSNGMCVSVRFGSLSELNVEQLMENCISVIEQISKILPKRKMLASAFVKTPRSTALPLRVD